MDALTLPVFQPEEIDFLLHVLSKPEPTSPQAVGAFEDWGSHMTISPQNARLPPTCEATRDRITCSMPQCNNAAIARGRCHSHGGRRRCKIEGCEKRGQERGLCAKHGGSDRCIIANCTNVARVAQRCAKHRPVFDLL